MSSRDNDSNPILTVRHTECMDLRLLIIEFCTIAIALRIIVSIPAISRVPLFEGKVQLFTDISIFPTYFAHRLAPDSRTACFDVDSHHLTPISV
eukprot:10890271-Ditylum_brightwellii.AAC.1